MLCAEVIAYGWVAYDLSPVRNEHLTMQRTVLQFATSEDSEPAAAEN